MNDDFPYATDGVAPDDPASQHRFPIVNTPYPGWAYITAVVVRGNESWLPAVRPTDDELRLVASFHEQYCSYWYGLPGQGFRRQMEARPFDIDGGANGRVLLKRPDGSWAYRRSSWTQGPAVMPPPEGFAGGEPLDLVGLLDHIHGARPDEPNPSADWTKWKAQHPEVFAAATR